MRNYSITFSPCLFFSCNEIYHPGKCYTRRYSFSFTSQILHQFLPSPVESLISVFIDTPKIIILAGSVFSISRSSFGLPYSALSSSISLIRAFKASSFLHQLVIMMEQAFYLLLVGQVFVHFIHIINNKYHY